MARDGDNAYMFNGIVIVQGHSGFINNCWFGAKNSNNIPKIPDTEKRIQVFGRCVGTNIPVQFLFNCSGDTMNKVKVFPAFFDPIC